jgi:hypothetical protein
MLKKKSFNLAVDMVSKLNKKSTSTMTLMSLINLGLASRYTSYVAVDPKEQKDLKESWMMMKSRDIPVQVAHWYFGASRMRCGAPVQQSRQSFGGMDQSFGQSSRQSFGVMGQSFGQSFGQSSRQSFGPMSFGFGPPPPMMPMPAMSMPMPMSNQAPRRKLMMRSVQPEYLDDDDDVCFGNLSPVTQLENPSFDASTDDRNQPQENTDDDKLMKLVSSQNFDGSFKLETSIAQLLDTTTDDITQGIFSHFSLTNKIQY